MDEGLPWINCYMTYDTTAVDSAAGTVCGWHVWPADAQLIDDTAAVVPSSEYPTLTLSGAAVEYMNDPETIMTTQGEMTDVTLAVSPEVTVTFMINDLTLPEMYDEFKDFKGKKRGESMAYSSLWGGNTLVVKRHPDHLDRYHTNQKWSGASYLLGAASAIVAAASTLL